MKVFLQMRAWQLFLVLVGAHFLMYATTIAVGHSAGGSRVLLVAIATAMPVPVAIFIAWFWALGTNTNQKVLEGIRPSPRLFRLALTYAFAYAVVFWMLSVLLSLLHASVGLYRVSPPFQLLAGLCLLYALYFIAKNFVMAERKEQVGFYDFAGPFFLILLCPIGVWFIQPRVNSMFQDRPSRPAEAGEPRGRS